MIDKMSQTQLTVFDSFYLSFVIVFNTTGTAHLKHGNVNMFTAQQTQNLSLI